MRRLCLLALITAVLPVSAPAHAEFDAFTWAGWVSFSEPPGTTPKTRDLTLHFDSVRTTSGGVVERSTGCTAVGQEVGDVGHGVATLTLVDCATGPQITGGQITLTRVGTIATFDGDFTCGSEPRVFREQKCVIDVRTGTLVGFGCELTPVERVRDLRVSVERDVPPTVGG